MEIIGIEFKTEYKIFKKGEIILFNSEYSLVPIENSEEIVFKTTQNFQLYKTVKGSRKSSVELYKEIHKMNEKGKLMFSAIVGENGSGKTTLLGILNNPNYKIIHNGKQESAFNIIYMLDGEVFNTGDSPNEIFDAILNVYDNKTDNVDFWYTLAMSEPEIKDIILSWIGLQDVQFITNFNYGFQDGIKRLEEYININSKDQYLGLYARRMRSRFEFIRENWERNRYKFKDKKTYSEHKQILGDDKEGYILISDILWILLQYSSKEYKDIQDYGIDVVQDFISGGIVRRPAQRIKEYKKNILNLKNEKDEGRKDELGKLFYEMLIDDLANFLGLDEINHHYDGIILRLERRIVEGFKLRDNILSFKTSSYQHAFINNIKLEPIFTQGGINALSGGEKAILLRLIKICSDLIVSYEKGKKNILILIDEPDLHLHLDWQRKFIKLFIDYIGNEIFKLNINVHVVLATHSPFILSDIESKNCLILGKNEKNKLKSFGANFIDLLSVGFFTEQNLGEFSKTILTHLSEKQKKLSLAEFISKKEIKTKKDSDLLDYLSNDFGEEYLTMDRIIYLKKNLNNELEIIDDGIIKLGINYF